MSPIRPKFGLLPPVAARSFREPHIDRLRLGPHVTNVTAESTRDTAPALGQLHTDRLSAGGLHVRTLKDEGEKPVPPPTPAGDGKLYRPVHGLGTWRTREAFNQPFLNPGNAFTPQDVFDFQVAELSPSIQQAVAEIEAKVPHLGLDAFQQDLSPLAMILLRAIQHSERRMPFKHLPGGSTQGLAQSGAVGQALMELAISVSIDNVVTAERLESLGPAGHALLVALREVVPAQRGLQVVLNRARLPIEPVGADVPLTREEAASVLESNPTALDQMVAEAPIPKALPALEAAKAQLPNDAFKGVHCVAVQHLLSTNVTMLDAMVDKGLDAKKTELIGIPYSTNFVVEHALRKKGFTVETPDILDPSQVTAAYEAAIAPALERALQRSLADGKPVLLIDDGGKLSTYVAKHFPRHASRFRAVEQTTRGLTELASLPSIPMPVVNVAKSPLKQWEMPHIGEQVVAQVEALASQVGLGGVTQKPGVVMGYGPIGEGIARALLAKGARVTVWDPDPKARERARKDGFDVPESREDALRGKSVALGGSGHRSLNREDLSLLAPGAVVGSASSRDLEVDLSPNHDQKVEVVPLLAQGRGDTRFITRVWRFEDRDVVVLKNGFPLNFTGGFETGSVDDIAPTRAAMLLGAAQALKETAPGLRDANVDAQRRVAKALGREL